MTSTVRITAGRRGGLHRTAIRLALGGALLATAGCGGQIANMDDRSTGSVPRDFRERHPIVISDQTRVLDVPVGLGDGALPGGTRETILGFLARYRAESEGVIQISRPTGAGNEAAAAAASSETAELLELAGVTPGLIVRTTYDVQGAASAPVRLAYTAVRSQVAGGCGHWPEDLASPELNHDNRNYHNFGCATQNNLAAQIANPTDLLHPRARTPIDAQRAANAIQDYQDNGNTVSPARGFSR